MQHWFIKYKLHHIPFWIAYHLMWLLLNIGNFNDVVEYLFKDDVPVKFIGYIVFQAAAVYFNLYYLIPRYLNNGNYKSYIFWLVCTILLCTGLITSGYFLGAYLSDKSFFDLFNKHPHQWFNLFSTAALPSTLGSMTLAMSVKLGKNWLNAEKKHLELKKENLETELKFLKSQINPHFLFNTINSIFVLIDKDADQARESLSSFSDMLRYQLYECNEDLISLSKELNFIENFIELERLRLRENQTDLVFEIDHDAAKGIEIAPFLLMPFIENAFKHLSKGKSQQHFIKLFLSISSDKILSMNLQNTYSKNTASTSGIGLKNVQRRLNLLYPNKHTLLINTDEKVYIIDLSIDLK